MVTLALSQSLFLRLGKELVEVEATGLGAEITTHFFPFSAGLMFFTFPNVFFPWLRDDFNGEGFVLVLVLATLMSGCDVTWELVVVVTVCKSLYHRLYVLLSSFCLLSSTSRLCMALAVIGVVATKLVIHFPTTGS